MHRKSWRTNRPVWYVYRIFLNELEKQVEPLERQSKAAREYLQLKEELKVCDANQFLLEAEHIQSQLNEISRKSRFWKEIWRRPEKGEDIRKEYDRLEAEIRSLEEAVLKERSRFNEASMEKNTLEGRINVLREQIHAEERNEEHIKSRKEAITEELKGKEEQLADFEAEQNRIGEQNTEELNRLNRARQEISEKKIISAIWKR